MFDASISGEIYCITEMKHGSWTLRLSSP